MINAKLRLDFLIFLERIKFVGIIVFLATICVIFFLVKLPPLGESSEETGEVISLRGLEGESVRLFLVVKIENGKEVLVKISSTNFYKKGQRVKLLKRDFLTKNGSKYYFQNYVNQ